METSTAVAHAEIVIDDFPTELIGAIEREKLDKPSVKDALKTFALNISLGEVSKQARSIIVTDETQTDLMRQAGDLRIQLRDERLRIDKIRETVKKPYLLKTQAIDGIARIIRTKFQEEEAYLAEQEQFAKIKQRQRDEKLNADRAAQLAEFAYEGHTSGLYTMAESQFELLLAGARATYQQKLDDIARRERESEERTLLERELREENDRLRRDKEEAERAVREAAAAARERIEEAENAARRIQEDNERRDRERLEAEAAERRRVADEKARAAAAPDREKLIAFADAIASIEIPSLISPEAIKLVERIAHDRETFVARIKSDADAVRFSDVPF